MTTIGQRLKGERNRLGMTQPAFGLVAGVQKGAQIAYEGDRRSPDAEYLGAVAQIGVDVLYVITGRREGALPPAAPRAVLPHDAMTLARAFAELPAGTAGERAGRYALFTQALNSIEMSQPPYAQAPYAPRGGTGPVLPPIAAPAPSSETRA